MPELNVSIEQQMLTISFESGATELSLKDLLDSHDLFLPGECGGVGKCVLCLVQIDSGTCSPLSRSEKGALTSDEIKHGCRLACQVKSLGSDLKLTIDEPASLFESTHPE